MNENNNIVPQEKTSSTAQLVLEIKNLNKSFGDNHVLKNFNMKLYKGENLPLAAMRALSVLLSLFIAYLTNFF